jgi:hypothetical protein
VAISGLWPALAHLLAGMLLCLTISGIPFGLASFKMAGLAVAPLRRRSFPVPRSTIRGRPSSPPQRRSAADFRPASAPAAAESAGETSGLPEHDHGDRQVCGAHP